MISDLSEDKKNLKLVLCLLRMKKQFQMLKKVSATRKKCMVLMFISQGA